MRLGFVSQRFVSSDGWPTQTGMAFRADYEAGVPVESLMERYGIGCEATCAKLRDMVEADKRPPGNRERVSTFELMRLYTRHQDCGIVGAIVGLKRIGAYQRLRRAGWSGIKGGNSRSKRDVSAVSGEINLAVQAIRSRRFMNGSEGVDV